MRIDDGSICGECKNFIHECDYMIGEEYYGCIEMCMNPKDKVQDNFNNADEIIDCESFCKNE